jgi:hypothetical protein
MDNIQSRIAAEKQHERKEGREYARCILAAIEADNGEALWRIGTCDDYYGGWERVFRRIDGGTVPEISAEIKDVFQQVWVEHKNWPLVIGKPRMLARALRRLLPPYHGPAVTLYRGASRHGWKRGFSWTDDIEQARRWMEPEFDGVLVMATVQPEAIICKITYPEPFSAEEKAAILRERPNCNFPDFSGEREYVVDPAGLTDYRILP